jgi:hypothetical protein
MRSVLAGAVLATAFVVPAVARAQRNDDLARADALFNAAKALLEAGQNVDACAKFAESERLAPGLGVTMYLADCYERIGRTASAWTEFRSAEGLARQRSDKRADIARARAQALEPKLDRLTLVVAPTVPLAGLQILRDGVVVAPEEWGIAVPVDPGDHVVLVSAPGHTQRALPAHLAPENPSVTIRIDRLDDTPSPALAPAPAAGAPQSSAATASTSSTSPEPALAPGLSDNPDPGKTRRWIGIAVGGAGVVGIAVGAVFGLAAKSRLDQSNDGHCDPADTCDPTGLSLRKDASQAAGASTVAFVVGGVALAGGIVVYLTAPRATKSVGFAVAPTVGGGSAMLRTTF